MPYFSLSVTPLSSALGFHNEVNWTDKLPYIYDTHATSVFSPGAIRFQHEEHLLEFNSAGMLADFFFGDIYLVYFYFLKEIYWICNYRLAFSILKILFCWILYSISSVQKSALFLINVLFKDIYHIFSTCFKISLYLWGFFQFFFFGCWNTANIQCYIHFRWVKKV